MAAQVRAIGGDRLEDLHGLLDEAIAKGARAALLVAVYEPGSDPEWEGKWSGKTSPAERAFICQSLIIIEVADGIPQLGDGES